MSSSTQASRINSLDQFRGYNVAGMFIVNFLGSLTITHQILKHNNTHFSLADSIMPGFIFACGFSFRMSYLNRLQKQAAKLVRAQFLRRSLALMLLSLMLFGWNSSFASWSDMHSTSISRFFAELVKANLWEVLAIIGACQILILPVIASPFATRGAWLLVFATIHILISWSFNYEFVYGRPNWLDPYFGAAGKRAWDGGIFGLLAWSEIMIVGSLAHDTLRGNSLRVAVGKMWVGALLLMLIGYGLSCLTTLYNINTVDAQASTPSQSLAASPVLPHFRAINNRPWRSLLAEPPFVVPLSAEKRVPNYWMMDKRVVSQSFTFFSSGFALAVYVLFVWFSDIAQRELPVLRTFGTNPLAAFIIHHLVDRTFLSVVPKDSPLHWCLLGLASSFGMTYLFVRFLEQRQLYLRL